MSGARHRVVIHGDSFADRRDDIQSALGPEFDVVTVAAGAPMREKADAFKGAVAAVTVGYDDATPAPTSLRLVQVPGIGWDGIDVDAIPACATVCNVGGHEAAVGEYAVAQMLEWCHQLRPAEDEFRRGSWERSSRFKAAPHRELSGSTVGIVGYGSIGRMLARQLSGFRVRVLAANRTPITEDSGLAGTFTLDEVEVMFAQCDFGVVALALASETTGLVRRTALDALGSEGVLVNVARGPVVDEDALWSALSEHRLGGAILDVWYRYPAANDPDQRPGHHPFETMPNVRMTPHLSGWTSGTVARRMAVIIDNIRAVATGGRPINVVSTPDDRA